MIIQKITAEDVKFFLNETTLGTIEKAGGFKNYISRFMTLAKSSKDILPQMGSVRINGELVASAMDFDLEEETIVSELNEEFVTTIKDKFGVESKASYKDAMLVFAYTSFSDVDHNYYLTAEKKVLNGLECENIELFINEKTVPYTPLLAKKMVVCDKLNFGLINEEEGAQHFSYPELSIFMKNSETPLMSINFWELEILDTAEPDEKIYFAENDQLVEELSSLIENSIGERIQQSIKGVL